MLWFIPTRNRPDAMAELISACREAGPVPRAAVMVDGPFEGYAALDWPENWQVHVAPEHLEMTRALNLLLELHPGEAAYGFMTDHGRPRSQGWSEALAGAAADWRMAFANDEIYRRTGGGNGWGEGLLRMPGATAWGGELVRAVGWIGLPGTVHFRTDDAWEAIGYSLGIITHHPALVHDLMFSTGAFPVDANHNRLWRGRRYPEHDARVWSLFVEHDLPEVLRRVRGAILGRLVAA